MSHYPSQSKFCSLLAVIWLTQSSWVWFRIALYRYFFCLSFDSTKASVSRFDCWHSFSLPCVLLSWFAHLVIDLLDASWTIYVSSTIFFFDLDAMLSLFKCLTWVGVSFWISFLFLIQRDKCYMWYIEYVGVGWYRLAIRLVSIIMKLILLLRKYQITNHSLIHIFARRLELLWHVTHLMLLAKV